MQISAAITKCAVSHHSFIVGKSSHARGSNMDSYDSDFELPKKGSHLANCRQMCHRENNKGSQNSRTRNQNM